jgi:hypothetical protein
VPSATRRRRQIVRDTPEARQSTRTFPLDEHLERSVHKHRHLFDPGQFPGPLKQVVIEDESRAHTGVSDSEYRIN